MSTTVSPGLPIAGATPAARRKGPPRWGIVAFLALLVGVVLLSQLLATGGTPIQWVENDLPAAIRRAGAENKLRIFLYLYDPNDPTHLRNERSVFSRRWAREPLAKVVCCRIALRPGDLLRVKYEYHNMPRFLLLNAQGKPEPGMRTEGPIDEREFMTYIGRPIEDAVKRGH